MSHIFISYSKTNITFARHLRNLLEDAGFAVWMDVRLVPHNRWWPTIEQNIRSCAAFVVIMTPEAQASDWVEREILLAEHESVNKPIFPVLLSGEAWPRLANIQYEDMTVGLEATLSPRFIDGLAQYAPRNTGATAPPPLPEPTLEIQPTLPLGLRAWMIAAVAFVLVIVVVMSLILNALNGAGQPQSTPTAANTSGMFTEIPTLEPTIDIVALVATLDTQATAAARATQIAAATQAVIDATATATLWTPTPTPTATLTPDITASIEAFITARDTATASIWTSTPTSTQTATPSPIYVGLPGAVTANNEWQSYVEQYMRQFSGIEMVLVPSGCFDMGKDPQAYYAGIYDVPDGGRQCFDKPFWFGRYEITNSQYGSPGHYDGDQRPREDISWLEARDFCMSRGMRLPTEAEWEYAARGPDNLIFPWGDSFGTAMSVWNLRAEIGTRAVGSRPGGVSWIGANDMSGNVWEWTNTILVDYPYISTDGREQNSDDTNIKRVVRGGSFFYDQRAFLHSASRNGIYAEDHNFVIGFRCARDFDPNDLN